MDDIAAIFTPGDENAGGRTINLSSLILAAAYNALIRDMFYIRGNTAQFRRDADGRA